MVVYLDELLFLNLFVNYFLLLSAGMLSGTKLRRGRIFCGALFGAGYACLEFFPDCAPLFSLWGKAAVSVGMCLMAYGYDGVGRMLRRTLGFYLVGFLFAGLMLLLFRGKGGAVMASLDTGVLLAAAAGAYLLLTLLRGTPALQEEKPPQAAVTLTLFGSTVTLAALLDTGNRLRDPLTNDRVLIAERRQIQDIFPPGLRRHLALFGVADAAAALRILAAAGYGAGFRLIPYSALGTQNGLLLALRPDRVEVDGRELRDVLVALTEQELQNDTGCSAILGA